MHVKQLTSLKQQVDCYFSFCSMSNKVKWKDSAVCALLYSNIVEGKLDGYKPAQAQATRDEYIAMCKVAFACCYTSLQKVLRSVSVVATLML